MTIKDIVARQNTRLRNITNEEGDLLLSASQRKEAKDNYAIQQSLYQFIVRKARMI